MNKPMTYKEISELDEELCKHCRCTDYGLNMKSKNGYMGVYYGCEGMFCDEAYENYLDDYEDGNMEEKNKYKVGDKVRVKNLDPDKYHESLIDYVGEILTINKIFNNNSYYVNENVWIWDEDMLEPVEEKITLKELQEIKNNVDHPKHYTNGKYECIDVIEDVTKDLTGLEAVCTANVIKYMWRWKLKNGVEDLKKARWYLNKLIDNTEIREIEETYQTEGMAD